MSIAFDSLELEEDTTLPAEHQVHVQRGHRPAHREGERLSTFDDYENRTSWEDILLPAGWSVHHQDSNGTIFWTRPGKSPAEGVSATTGYGHEADLLYVFSTSTEFDTERPYSKSQAYALLHHGGDLSQAAKDLYAQGYGERFPTRRRADTPKRAKAKKPPRALTLQEERSEMASEALRRVTASLHRPDPAAITRSSRTPQDTRSSFSTVMPPVRQTR